MIFYIIRLFTEPPLIYIYFFFFSTKSFFLKIMKINCSAGPSFFETHSWCYSLSARMEASKHATLENITNSLSSSELAPEPTDSLAVAIRSNELLSKIVQQMKVSVPSFDDGMEELAVELLNVSDTSTREENKLELLTVFSIIKIINQIESLLPHISKTETAHKIYIVLLSLANLFKYHFQLPVYHNNYAFKNFGSLIACSQLNVIDPFIKCMSAKGSRLQEFNKSENLEKTFTLICILHCFNEHLFSFLKYSIVDGTMGSRITESFGLETSPSTAKYLTAIPSLFGIMQRYRMSLLLDESTLSTDYKGTNLLNIIFYSSFHMSFLHDLVKNLSKIGKIFKDPLTKASMIELANEMYISSSFKDYLTIYITSDLGLFASIDSFVGEENPDQQLRDISIFVLLHISSHFFLNYNTFRVADKELLLYLIEYNNPNYCSILGVSSEDLQSNLNINTLLPIFELIDQNIKLDYTKERDFLKTLKLALITLELNLETEDGFMNLNSLLVDVGCSKSIHALLAVAQTLLCITLNSINFNSNMFNQIPKGLVGSLGIEYIPPVYRSDMSFENNIDLQSSNYGSLYHTYQEFENYPKVISDDSISLLEQSLLLLVSIKSRSLRFLKKLNAESNVLRLPDLFSSEVKDEFTLNQFKQGISTRVGSFKSNKALSYKLLNKSVTLELTANISLLILGENYKLPKLSFQKVDNSISRLLNEFTFDFMLTFLINYQEFGLLNFFKCIRDLCHENLRMIMPSAILLSKLFQVKQDNKLDSSSKTTDFSSSIELIAEILYNSVIASNLLRQFVELFDDGQSKPFKSLNKFLKAHPSTLKPSKIVKGTTILDIDYYKQVLY